MVDGNPSIMCGFLGLIKIGIQPTNGMCKRISIRIRKAYFYGRHVDFVWYGKRGIRSKMKKVCGSFIWNRKIMILNWM
jgi:hypothetical protein